MPIMKGEKDATREQLNNLIASKQKTPGREIKGERVGRGKKKI